MAFIHLKSGEFEQVSENELGSVAPASIMRRALLVYEGEFESMDGQVIVGRDELTTLATNHNGYLESASRLAEGKESMKDYPPVQLDHSTSAKDTVGRLVGKLELAPHKTKDGREVMAAYGNVKILGEENVAKVMDGRWTHLSVGVDFEKGKFSELTITPFPAAPEASLLKKNTETKLGPQDEAFKKYKNLWTTLNTKMDDDESDMSSADRQRFDRFADPLKGQDQEDGLMDWEGELSDLQRFYRELSGKGKLSSKETEMSRKRLAHWISIDPANIEFNEHSQALYWQSKQNSATWAGIALNVNTNKWDWVLVEAGWKLAEGTASNVFTAKQQVESAIKKEKTTMSQLADTKTIKQQIKAIASKYKKLPAVSDVVSYALQEDEPEEMFKILDRLRGMADDLSMSDDPESQDDADKMTDAAYEFNALKRKIKLSEGKTMNTANLGKYKYTISYKGDKIMKVIDAADEEEAEEKILDYAAEAFDLKTYSEINQVKITKMSIKKLNSWKQVHQNQADSYYEKRIGEYVLRAGFSDEEGQYFWNIAKKNNPQDEIDGGVVSTLTEAMRQAGAAASKLGVKLSEGDKSMDKDKMKKHMMEVQEMSEKDAEEKLAKCTEEEMKKLAAEVEEHEKKMAQEKPEEKKEMSEEKPEDKKEMSEAKEDEKKEMSKEEEKKDLAKEEDEDKEEMESSKEDKKLSAARERIVRLSSDFRKAFEGAQLAAKKGKIVSRLSSLKANAKITPAEIKKIDIEKLAGQGDETVDLVLKTYEDREPVVMTGALGSIKADELHRLSNEIKMSRLEAETRKNMSLLKHTVKTRMQEEKEGGEVSIHVDTTPHVDQEIEMAYGSVCKMMDEGKLAEAKELLKKYMMKPKSEGRMDMVEHDKQLSALAEESIKMQNKFDELQKLAVSLVG